MAILRPVSWQPFLTSVFKSLSSPFSYPNYHLLPHPPPPASNPLSHIRTHSECFPSPATQLHPESVHFSRVPTEIRVPSALWSLRPPSSSFYSWVLITIVNYGTRPCGLGVRRVAQRAQEYMLQPHEDGEWRRTWWKTLWREFGLVEDNYPGSNSNFPWKTSAFFYSHDSEHFVSIVCME